MKKKLSEVTFLTLKKLNDRDVVLPNEYIDTFNNIADDFGINIENNEYVNVLQKEKEEQINNIVHKTNENLEEIKNSTCEAQIAIENNDKEKLSKINCNLLEMQKKIELLQNELYKDGLTKAYNRKWLMEKLVSKEHLFLKSGYFIFVDVNNFKNLNDTYGHLIGDQVLIYIKNYLNKELNIFNTKVIRYAGDEFIIYIEENKLKEKEIDNKIIEIQLKLLKLVLKTKSSKKIKIGFSYGLSYFNKNDIFEEILEKTDELMYQNKKIIKEKL